MDAGIDAIGFYVPQCVLDLRDLARARSIPYAKLAQGLGQERMAIAPPGEDIVTMGAHAAHEALENVDRESIDTIIVATESGVDQSKSAAIYLHRLLELPKSCKAFEIKQACCGSTVALHLAMALVQSDPRKRVLVVASDVARYERDSPGESTQGAGSVAFVVSRNPRILRMDPYVGSYTDDVMDFWRPNYRETACVDGHYSMRVYLRALGEAWTSYRQAGGPAFMDHDRFCYHLPFTQMAQKAHHRLAVREGCDHLSPEIQDAKIASGLRYNREVGNTYTASLYLSLLSMLECTTASLAGKRIGMFSYGSGCMGAFFSGVVQSGYRRYLDPTGHQDMLDARRRLSMDEYEELMAFVLPEDGSRVRLPTSDVSRFRFAGLDGHKRIYDACSQQPAYAEVAAA
jgi:hydroxymethylglutaryl-CoA synthase